MTRTEMEHWIGNLTSEETVTLAEIALNDISDNDAAEVIVSACLNNDEVRSDVAAQLND